MAKRYRIGLLLLLSLNQPLTVAAQSRVTTEPEFRVCSQNAHNLGPSKSAKELGQLVDRIYGARCDIVALQEVVGDTREQAHKSAERLVLELAATSGRKFDMALGEANDSPIRNAVVYATDLFVLERAESFASENLPTLQQISMARRSLRGPDAVLLKYRGAPSRCIYLVNFHFKSKVQGWKDPTNTSFEATRVEMAEGLRSAVERVQATLPEGTVVMLLGDRNSETSSASAAVLRGERRINDFRHQPGCRIDRDLQADCPSPASRPVDFESLFSESSVRGSYKYHGNLLMLDDILIREKDRWIAEDDRGVPVVGVSGSFGKGSDHKLLWAEVNW